MKLAASSCLAALSLAAQVADVAAQPTLEGDCVYQDAALEWLYNKLSPAAAIACAGYPLQLKNANRYWGTQFGKNASVVVYPASAADVSKTVQAAQWAQSGQDFAFVGGGHSMINASSAYGMVADLTLLSKASVVQDFAGYYGEKVVAVEYEGGANWGQVQLATNGTGYTAVGARVANVGAGGFSTGGGIGFLAGAYGFAVDRLLQMEVVVPSGEIITARKDNKHSDLFWALQGGSGQFGIVTKFWQEAAIEPKKSTLSFYYINKQDVPRLREQTVAFFENNTDPFSVIYYSYGYLPSTLQNPQPSDYAKRHLLITVHFDDPTNPSQLDNNATFQALFNGINTNNGAVLTTEYYSQLVFVGEAAYPYGFRRGFYGPQTTKIDVDYLSNLDGVFDKYLDDQIAAGETPYSASYIVQYMFPGLNGHLPKHDADTAWPHSVAGHQTLFTPAYLHASHDGLMRSALKSFNDVTFAQQRRQGKALANYPNYISPGDTGRMVWGDNVARLTQIKEKYDQNCLIRNGRVFSSPGCAAAGFANIYA